MRNWTVAALSLVLSGALGAAVPLSLGVDAGYTDFTLNGLNQDNINADKAIHQSSPPAASVYTQDNQHNGYYISLDAAAPVWRALSLHAKVEYLRSAPALDSFNLGGSGGPYVYRQESVLSVVPVMLGLGWDAAPGSGLVSVEAGLYGGVGLARFHQDVDNENMPPIQIKPTGSFDGGAAVPMGEADLKAGLHLAGPVSLNLNAGYRLAAASQMYDSGGRAFAGVDGRAIGMDFSGWNLGVGLNYDFNAPAGALGLLDGLWAAQAPPSQGFVLGMEGGYATLDVRGVNAPAQSLQQFMSGAPIPYSLVSNPMVNGYYVGLNGVFAGLPGRPGIKVQYLQSETAYLHDSFVFIPGQVLYDEQLTACMIPVMLGVNPVLWSAGPLELGGSLYAGYAVAMADQGVQKQNWFFGNTKEGLTRGVGGNFIAQGGLDAHVHLGSRLSLAAQAVYRQAEMGTLKDSGGDPIRDFSGETMDFDLSGWNLGGSLVYAF